MTKNRDIWHDSMKKHIDSLPEEEVDKIQERRMIVIDDCLHCPQWMECPPSKKLTPKQRFTLTCGVGIGKFILKGCPLDVYDM